MSVASTTNKVQYTITGLPQVLTVNFVFDLDTDLLVLDGNTVLTNASDYSLTTGGSGATGTITVVGTGAHAVQVNDVVTIMRNVPLTQLTSFDSTGVLTAAMIVTSRSRASRPTARRAPQSVALATATAPATVSALML